MPEYIDTHSHLQLPEFDADRDEVIARMRERGVATIAVGVDFLTSRAAVALAQQFPGAVLGATIGVHPTDSDEDFDPEIYADLFAVHESPGERRIVVGVGECGFDYFRTPRVDVHARQKEVFEAQVAFALEHDLPLMLHVRPSKGSQDAHEDALAILEAKHAEVGDRFRGNAHFFTGSLESAKRYWALGFTTAFPGVITFAREYEEVVRACPSELMLSETDAPFAAPIPHRGERCEPIFVADTVAKLAMIRNEDPEALKKALVRNAVRVFGLAVTDRDPTARAV